MQYMVQESDINKREIFFNYIINNYSLDIIHFSKDRMINSHFPFIVDFDRNEFWVCESITCCACASQKNRIISIDEFMNLTLDKSSIKTLTR